MWLGSTPPGPPPPPLLANEASTVWELGAFFASLPWLATAPLGDGHPVMVLPGFLMDDRHTAPLRGFLRSRGYAVHGWMAGPNVGRWTVVQTHLVRYLSQLRRHYGRRVSLVGWSMGGLFARELAMRCTDDVRMVITLASGFKGDPRANNVWPVYPFFSGHRVTGLQRHGLLRAPLPVPSTSIHSRIDGIVDWRCCLQEPTPRSENIEIVSSHHGMGHHPAALAVVADRLAQPEGVWQPYRPARIDSNLGGTHVAR